MLHSDMQKNTLIIGASHKPDRYAYKAQKALTEAGHLTIPFSIRGGQIEGVTVVSNLTDISHPIHTVTLYVRPQILEGLMDSLIELKPKRIIFNPGTEDTTLEETFRNHNVEVIQGCTLVMLQTGQF